MSKSITIRTRGVVRTPCAYSMYAVELYNEDGKLTGHEVLATPQKRLQKEGVKLNADDIVFVELCTSYKDKAKILDIAG